MKFRLIHKKLGVKSIELLSQFNYSGKIRDICFVNDLGFLCLGEDALLLVTDKECKKILSLENPMSICQGDLCKVYVAYNKGIKRINYKDNYSSDDINVESVFLQLKKIGVKDIFIHTYQDFIAIAIAPLHKFYKMRKQSIEKEYGSGIPEYSVASNLSYCSIFNPQGILIYDSSTIFISDTGNGCIRSFGNSHRIVVGDVINPSMSPTKLLLDRKRDLLYYLSKNYLKSVMVNGERDATLYENQYLLSMTMADDKIYVLEGENE